MAYPELNFDKYPQKPHGGVLIDQRVPEEKRASEIERARTYRVFVSTLKLSSPLR